MGCLVGCSTHDPRAAAGPHRARSRLPAPPAVGSSQPVALPPQAVVGAPPLPEPRFHEPVVPQEQTVVRVLMYHSIGWHPPRPGVNPRRFREQLTWLKDNHVEVIAMSTLVEFLETDLELPRRVAVVTIDDGERNGYTVAYPILKDLKIPFTLGIVSDAVTHHESHGTVRWDQLREMVDSGLCEIASHSHTHRMMAPMDDRVAATELEISRQQIEEHTGYRPTVFFYPMGSQNKRIRRLTARVGYRAAFVAWGAPVRRTTRRFGLPRYAVEKGTGMYTFSRYFVHGD